MEQMFEEAIMKLECNNWDILKGLEYPFKFVKVIQVSSRYLEVEATLHKVSANLEADEMLKEAIRQSRKATRKLGQLLWVHMELS